MSAVRWMVQLILSILLGFIHVTAGENSIDPGLDSTLNHVKYDSIHSLAFDPRRVAEKARLLSSIANPVASTELFDYDHPRYHLLYAMYGFWRHGERCEADVQRSKENYNEVEKSHKAVSIPYRHNSEYH
jgi:hypothetical protein